MEENILEVFLSEDRIRGRVREMGRKITEDYTGKRLILVSVLKGSAVFMADLMRSIDLDLTIDFMAVSSYGSGVKTTGVVKIIKDLDLDVSDCDVLLVEDILDSGKTLHYIRDHLLRRNVKSLKIAAFLDKPERRQVDLQPDYVGFTVPDEFVVGYGMDYAEHYRGLPYIGILKPEVYEI